MARSYIVDSTPTQVVTGACKEVLIQVNAALTGSIKVIDGIAGSTANVATITNPPAGPSPYVYRDFINGVRIIASGPCDVAVNANTGSTY